MWYVVPPVLAEMIDESNYSRSNPAPECIVWLWCQDKLAKGAKLTVTDVEKFAGYYRSKAHRVLRSVRGITTAQAA